jgi:16S rRNA (cytidine1402-2'-O)-methyltransferase
MLQEDIRPTTKADKGTLYVIGTPIGNLEDISLRALSILKTVDWIAAEDTRHSGQMLHFFGIKKPMLSYFEHNKKARSERIIELLRQGNSVGLVTDAGMPGISDPGADLVRDCIEQDIPIAVIPGPTAFVTALVASGLDTAGFAFGGFMPRENKQRKEWLKQYGGFASTVLMYESPKRIIDTLALLQESWGDRACCVGRELTKHYEEFCRGCLSEVREKLMKREAIKGECVIVVAGAQTLQQQAEPFSDIDIMMLGQTYIDQGCSTKEASQLIAQKTGLPKREVYNLLIQK